MLRLRADELLAQLRACVDEKAHDWRMHAASTVLLLGEIIYGASPAWTDVCGWQHLDPVAWHMSEEGVCRASLVSTAAAAVDDAMAPALFSANEGARVAGSPTQHLLPTDVFPTSF